MRKRTPREIRAIKAKNYRKGGVHSSMVDRNRPIIVTRRIKQKNSSTPINRITSHVRLENFEVNIQRKPNEHEAPKKISIKNHTINLNFLDLQI